MATARTTVTKPASKPNQTVERKASVKAETVQSDKLPPKYVRGVQTTEFWLQNIAQAVLFLNTSHAWTYMPTKWSATIQGAIMIAYIISRGWVKAST